MPIKALFPILLDDFIACLLWLNWLFLKHILNNFNPRREFVKGFIRRKYLTQ